MTLLVDSLASETLDAESFEAPVTGLSDADYARKAIGERAVYQNGEVYYEAADPGYKAHFTRDSLKTAWLAGDKQMLISQLDYSARRIGYKFDPISGMQPGQLHHQMPAHNYNEIGLNTAYCACDTTALGIISIAELALREASDPNFKEELDELNVPSVIDRYKSIIPAMAGYIQRHVNKYGLFFDDPALAGNTNPNGRDRKFGLKVTYWKDSELNRVNNTLPHYPIVYTLPHFQNADALWRLGYATQNLQMVRFAEYMYQAGFTHLWQGDHFVTAVDSEGVIDQPSTDSLYALNHIDPSLLPNGYAQKIADYSMQLETDAGFRAGIPMTIHIDPYHTFTWMFEQAFHHAAAVKYDLLETADIAARSTNHINPSEGQFHEAIDPDNGYKPEGNERQLWTMGMAIYFDEPDRAIL